jgi:hypothetical protein
VLLGFACVWTHHLSSIVLAGFMILFGLLARPSVADIDLQRSIRRATYGLISTVVALVIVWIGLVARSTLRYLAPHITVAAEIGSLKGNARAGAASGTGAVAAHELFAGGGNPAFERLAALASPAVVGILAVTGGILWLLRRRMDRTCSPFIVLGALYFLSLPFSFVAAAGEGVHRSWGYSYLGLAIVVAAAITWVLDRGVILGKRSAGLVHVGLVAATVIVLIGNVAAGEDVDYRFPGPYQFGDTTRDVTPELSTLAHWMLANVPHDTAIVTDTTTGIYLEGHADVYPPGPSQFEQYSIFNDRASPAPQLLTYLERDRFRYLVVDTRITDQLPASRLWPGWNGKPISAAVLARFQRSPWTSIVYSSDHFIVYRLRPDLASEGAP